MQNLESLLLHSSIAGSSHVRLASDKPILIVKNGEEKEIGKPLTTETIGKLLKASLPTQILSEFKWGKNFTHSLSVGESDCEVRVYLTQEKTFHVEVASDEREKSEAPSVNGVADTAAAEPATEIYEEADPAEVQALMEGENLALVYLGESASDSSCEDVVSNCGFKTKITKSKAAFKQVVSYCDYPIVILELDQNFEKDPIFYLVTQMEMQNRRKQFHILCAPGLKTGDQMKAFSLSVNFVIAPEDLKDLPEYLEREQSARDRTVSLLRESLIEAGRY